MEGKTFSHKWCLLTKRYHRGEFMLKGKCFLLEIMLNFPSANRALTLKFIHATCGWQFWLRPVGALCTWVFGKNMEPHQCPNRLLGYLKIQGPNGGCSEYMLLSVEASGPSTVGSWANASFLSVFLPQSSEEWAQEIGGYLNPHMLFPTPKACVCTHTMLVMVCSLGTSR